VRISAAVAYILLYTALYAVFGVASPFWPRFFETRGLSPQEIGIVLAAALVTRLLAGPTVGMLADRAGSLRFALAVCTALAAAWAAALLWVHSFALLLFIAVLQAASLAPTTSLADALSVNAASPRLAGKEFEYGWIRGKTSIANFQTGASRLSSPSGEGRLVGLVQLVRNRDSLSAVLSLNGLRWWRLAAGDAGRMTRSYGS
jgi:MFS transporter, PPP family, 3-phenylpropionic acid transporter